MLQFLQLYLGNYQLDTARASSIIHNHELSFLKLLLRKGDHKSREIMLKQLVKSQFFAPALIPSFLRVLSKDSIGNAQMALLVLEERLLNHPKYMLRFQAAKASLADRLRRKANRQKVQDHFQLKSETTFVDRKAQMHRLAKVKKDLTKGMKRIV